MQMVAAGSKDRARTYSAVLNKPTLNKWMLQVNTSRQFSKHDFNATNQQNQSSAKQMYSFPKSARKFIEPLPM
jgi:hypothetical protein